MKIVKTIHSVKEYDVIKSENQRYRQCCKINDIVVEGDKVYIQSKPIEGIEVSDKDSNKNELIIFRFLEITKSDLSNLIELLLIRKDDMLTPNGKHLLQINNIKL